MPKLLGTHETDSATSIEYLLELQKSSPDNFGEAYQYALSEMLKKYF